MQNQNQTADQAAQVAATAQQLESIIHAYGNPLSERKTTFQMPAKCTLSKVQIKRTHHLLKSEYTPNFATMLATFRKLLINAPYALEKESELRIGFMLLSHLQGIYNAANLTNYLAEITTDEKLKNIILSDATRHLNYGSLMAMEGLLHYKEEFHYPLPVKKHILTCQLQRVLLHLYVPNLSHDEEFSMDALLELLLVYDK